MATLGASDQCRRSAHGRYCPEASPETGVDRRGLPDTSLGPQRGVDTGHRRSVVDPSRRCRARACVRVLRVCVRTQSRLKTRLATDGCPLQRNLRVSTYKEKIFVSNVGFTELYKNYLNQIVSKS